MARVARLDLTDRSRASEAEQPARSADARAALAEYGAPPGYPTGGLLTARPARRAAASAGDGGGAARGDARRARLKAAYSDAWAAAFEPGRALLPAAFMLWVTGSSGQLFSIMSVVGVVFVQVRGLLAVRPKFRAVVKRNPDLKGMLWGPVVVYSLLSLVGVGGALYKCRMLGLLPTEESDWVGLLPPEVVESRVVIGTRI